MSEVLLYNLHLIERTGHLGEPVDGIWLRFEVHEVAIALIVVPGVRPVGQVPLGHIIPCGEDPVHALTLHCRPQTFLNICTGFKIIIRRTALLVLGVVRTVVHEVALLVY